MTRTAAKRRKLFSSAAVCLTASLLLASSVEASRSQPASLSPSLEPPIAVPVAPIASPSFEILTDEDRFLFAAASSLYEDELAQVLDRRRFRPLGDTVSRDLASGVSTKLAPSFSLGSSDLGWKSHQGDYFLEPDPLGPVDSPNLYQAFGFDGMNVTDPYGECWTGGCIETLKSAAGYVVGLGLSGAELVAAPVTMAATESVDAYNNLARVSSAYQAAGVEAAWSEADMIGREETEENKQRLLGMIPFVNTVRQGSQVIRTYEEEGSFAGGMQVGRTTFSLGVDATVVYGAASGVRAATRSSPSATVPGGGPGVKPVLQERLAAYKAWKASAGIRGAPSSTQFRRFMAAHRPTSRGVTLYAPRTQFSPGSSRLTYLYQKVSPRGEHLKFGVTVDPLGRYTAAELGGGRLRILATGPKNQTLRLERSLHKNLPLGPEEGQLFYRLIQIRKGLAP